jgi:hypothetical protein
VRGSFGRLLRLRRRAAGHNILSLSLSLRFSRKKKSVDVFGKKIFFLQKKKRV